MSTSRRYAMAELYEAYLVDCWPEIAAVAPGAGTEELVEKLKHNAKDRWIDVCGEYAQQRAEEACHVLKDGDLYYRTGNFIWQLYWSEFDAALRLVKCRMRSMYLDEAGFAFEDTVERARTLRLGPGDQLHLLDPRTLEYSAPFLTSNSMEVAS